MAIGTKLQDLKRIIVNHIFVSEILSRKRPRGRRSGSRWAGAAWWPGVRLGTPWKVGRRRPPAERPVDTEDMVVLERQFTLKERVVEHGSEDEMDTLEEGGN